MAAKDTQEPLQLREIQEHQAPTEPPAPLEPPFSIFPKWERSTYVYIASLAAFASPVSSSIYYPAMLSLAEDLNKTLADISLTITTYMVRPIPIAVYCRRLTRSRYSKELHLR